ncbi:MAG TPA: histidine kinase dimerization/phospho-acceptor domain-containing protein, partial [Clostridia bacterium]|nr:histidine kinase dimerization/phospho-acceptor domain-containing protein [Clostridia bacterium]
MKQVHLFENSGVRRLFALLAVLTAVYLLTAFFLNQISVSRFEAVLINRESAVAGKLIALHPEQSDEIISAFVTAGNIKDSERGTAAFGRAGYSGQTVPVVFPSIRGELGRITALYTAPALTALIFFGILTFFALSAIYGRVEQAGKKALSVSRGNYGLRLEEDAEGTFARMNYAFNEMSSGVNAGFEKLRQERVFLKNLISDISHQLKTPLATLKMYNEILLQEPLSGAARDFTVKSSEQLERMEWLILGLLKMARMEAGCLEMNLKNANATVI